MTEYNVFVTFTFEDALLVEADSREAAMEIAESDMQERYSVVDAAGFSLPWNDVSAYDAEVWED